MDEKQRRSDDPENLNPAHREEESISKATDELDTSEDVVIVDERLREKEEIRIKEEAVRRAEANEVTEVTRERSSAPVVTAVSERNTARLLVLTRDTNVFVEGSRAALHILELSKMFAEVHVIVLNTKSTKSFEIARIGDYAWVYPTNSRFWLWSPFDARRVAKQQLVFANGFRPDAVISKDSFEAGFAGYLIAGKYRRPLQLHIVDDFFDPYFKDADDRNSWRLMMSDFVLKRATCVRTQTEYLKSRIVEKYSALSEVTEILPVYYNLDAWAAAQQTIDVRQRYPSFRLILLHVSNMNEFSHTKVAIDGLYYLLKQYPTVGLVIVGDGPDKEELVKTVDEYELQDHIVFESPDIDTLSLMKSANMLIHTSEETSEEEVLLQAAVSELPIISGNRGLASELFIDEESVLLCPVDSPPCFGEKVNRLLNENPLRKKLTLNARETVFDSVEQDYNLYIEAYRGSIEQCLVAGS